MFIYLISLKSALGTKHCVRENKLYLKHPGFCFNMLYILYSIGILSISLHENILIFQLTVKLMNLLNNNRIMHFCTLCLVKRREFLREYVKRARRGRLMTLGSLFKQTYVHCTMHDVHRTCMQSIFIFFYFYINIREAEKNPLFFE